MPKWKEGAKEFTVSVTYNERRGYQVNMPRPIVELMGRPEKVTFSIKGKKIVVSPGIHDLETEEVRNPS